MSTHIFFNYKRKNFLSVWKFLLILTLLVIGTGKAFCQPGQTYYYTSSDYCTISASDILADATKASGTQTISCTSGGTWIDNGGLTQSGTSESATFTIPSDGTYTLIWRCGGTNYTIELDATIPTTTLTLTDFHVVEGCGDYNPRVSIAVSDDAEGTAADPSYYAYFSATDGTNTVGVGNPVKFGSSGDSALFIGYPTLGYDVINETESGNLSVTLTRVVDLSTGCDVDISSYLGDLTQTYYYHYPIEDDDVTVLVNEQSSEDDYCAYLTGQSLSISVDDPVEGVVYYLYDLEEDEAIQSTEQSLSSTVTSIEWEYTTAGIYTVYAYDGYVGLEKSSSHGSTYCHVQVGDTYTLYPSLTIDDDDVCEGETATITFKGYDYFQSYKLYKTTTGSTDDGTEFSGATKTIDSNAGSITWKVSNATAGIYYVVATDNCNEEQIYTGVEVLEKPTSTGIGLTGSDSCLPTYLSIQITSPEDGITYYLSSDNKGETVISGSEQKKTSTTSTLSWSQSTTGTYYLWATNNVCDQVLLGTYILYPDLTAYTLSSGSTYNCYGSTITLTLSGSDTYATYQLYKTYDGTATTVGSAVTGTGNALEWNVSDIGTYTVIATSTNCTGNTKTMTGSVTISAKPTTQKFTDADGDAITSLTTCTTSGLYLSAAEEGVTYTVLFTSDDTNPVTKTYTYVCETDGTIVSIVSASEVASNGTGTYVLSAKNTDSGCSVSDMAELTIIEGTNPSILSFLLPSDLEKCYGTSEVFTITFAMTPSSNGPWTVVMKDNSGNSYTTTIGNGSNTWTTSADLQNSRTFYVYSVTDVNGCKTIFDSDDYYFTITVNPLPTVSITSQVEGVDGSEICDGGLATLSASASNVTVSDYSWSTNAITQSIIVTPSTTTQYSVTLTSDKGCSNIAYKTITVNELPDVSIANTDTVLCENDTYEYKLVGLVDGTESSSGTFYLDGTEITTNTFVPSVQGEGSYLITYEYTDLKGCSNSFSRTFVVKQMPTVSLSGVGEGYCSDDGDVTFYGYPQNSNGSFTINGLDDSQTSYFTDNGNGTATFSPSGSYNDGADSKTYKITYSYTNEYGCISTVSETTTIYEQVDVYFELEDDEICEDASIIELQAYLGTSATSGQEISYDDADEGNGVSGSFSGDGILDETGYEQDNQNGIAYFSPSVAGYGTHTITYTYTDANGCSGEWSVDIKIGSTLVVDFGESYCSTETDPVELTASVVDGSGTETELTSSDEAYFNLYDSEDNEVTGFQNYSIGKEIVPANLGAGEYKLILYYNDGWCTNTDTTEFTISDPIAVDFAIINSNTNSSQTTFCIEDGKQEIELADEVQDKIDEINKAANDAGKEDVVNVYYYINGYPATNYFNPSTAKYTGEDTPNTITVEIDNNGCITSKSISVVVIDPEIKFSGLEDTYCSNDDASEFSITVDDATLTSGDKLTVTYTTNDGSEKFITYVDTDDDGEKDTYYVNPSVGPGLYIVTATYENESSHACTKTYDQEVTVYYANDVKFSGFTNGENICKSANPITLTGTYYENGTGTYNVYIGETDYTDKCITDGDNSDGNALLTLSSLSDGTYTVKYTFVNANGCTTYYEKSFTVIAAPVDVFNIVSDNDGAYCVGGKGVTIGLDDSEKSITYELLYKGQSVSSENSLTVNILVDDDPKEVTLTDEITYTRSVDASGSNEFAFNYTSTGAVGTSGTDYKIYFTDEGIYSVVGYYDSYGCQAYMDGTVTVDKYDLGLLSDEDALKNISCYNESDGSITVVPSGGSGSYAYRYTYEDEDPSEWQENNPVFENLKAGKYVFDIKDLSDAGCVEEKVLTVEITQPDEITVSVESTNVTCNGENDGIITITAKLKNSEGTTSSGPFEYSIDGGENWLTTSVIKDLSPATYNVVVRNTETECEVSKGDVTILDAVAIEFSNAVIKDMSCANKEDGKITVTVSGGTINDETGYTYTWYKYNADGSSIALTDHTGFTGSISKDAANYTCSSPTDLSAGDYYVKVEDANGCSATSVVTIDGVDTYYTVNEPEELEITEVGRTDISCNDSKGAISFKITGIPDDTDLKYTLDESTYKTITGISDNEYILNLTELSGGTKTLLVKTSDDNVCEVSISFTLNNPEAFSTDITSSPETCFGDKDGSLSFSTTYTTSGNNGNFVYSIDNGVNWTTGENYIEGLSAGKYSVIVKDLTYGCIKDAVEATVSGPTAAISVSVKETDVACNGNKNGKLEATVSGGNSESYTYKWYNGENPTTIISTTQDCESLSVGEYYLYVEDSKGCGVINTDPYIIEEPDEIVITEDESAHVDNTCNGDKSGSITVSVTGREDEGTSYFYSWKKIYSSTSSLDLSEISTTNTISGLSGGTYQLTVTTDDTNKCTATATFTIEEPLAFTTTITQDNISCNSENDGSFTFVTKYSDGSTGSFSYSKDGGSTWESSPITGLTDTSYDLWVKDNSSDCTKSLGTYTFIRPDALAISDSTITDVTCNGESDGKLSLKISGGIPLVDETDNSTYYLYYWYDEGGNILSSFTGNTISNVAAGVYYVKIVDANGCSITSDKYTIEQPTVTVVDKTVTTVSVYNGTDGSIVINNVTSYYDYEESNIKWYYYATDAVTGVVTETALTSEGNAVTGYTASNLAAGTYYFEITDINNCTYKSEDIVITQPGVVTAVVNKTDITTCYGSATGSISVKVTEGTAPYSIYLTGTLYDGTSYSYSGNPVTAVNTSFTGLSAGNYTVNVVDSEYAAYTKDVTIAQPTEVVFSNEKTTHNSCNNSNDGSITINVSGGTPTSSDTYDYVWYQLDENNNATAVEGGADVVTKDATSGEYEITSPSLAAGDYYVTVTDANSCEVSSDTYPVTEPDPVVITKDNTSITELSCYGDATGAISVTVSGRTSGYSYQWEGIDSEGNTITLDANEAVTNSISDLPAGSYTITVIANGETCEYSETYTITQPSAPLSLDGTNVTNITSCKGEDDGKINVIITGGTKPYTIVFDGSEYTADDNGYYTIGGLTAGTYNFMVYDNAGKGCNVQSVDYEIEEPEEAIGITLDNSGISCENSDGVIDFTVKGGVTDADGKYNYTISVQADNGYSYVYNQEATDKVDASGKSFVDVLKDLAAGTYTIFATDNNADASAECATTSETVDLENVVITGDIVDPTCEGSYNGSITNIIVSGGSGSYDIAWNTSDGSVLIDNVLDQTGLSDGTYTLTITDKNISDCSVEKSFTLVNSNTVAVSGNVIDASCNGYANGSIDISVDGEGTNTTYLWTSPTDVTLTDPSVADQSGLATGTYSVTVTTTVDGTQCSDTEEFAVGEPEPISFDLSYEVKSCDPYERTLTITHQEAEDDNDDTADEDGDGSNTMKTVAGATGGNGDYSYSWTGPEITNTPDDPTNFVVEIGGDYTVEVYDNKNCRVSENIYVPEEISITSAVNQVSCYGESDGSVSVTVSGGSGNPVYAWTGEDSEGNEITLSDDEKSTNAITGLAIGTYVLTVTDAVDAIISTDAITGDEITTYCSKSYTFTITQPLDFTTTIDTTAVTCNGANDGILTFKTLYPGEILGDFVYSLDGVNWTDEGVNSISGLSPSTSGYIVYIKDLSNGCVKTQTSKEIREPAELKIDETKVTITDIKCHDDKGSISLADASDKVVAVTGGTGDYNYAWFKVIKTEVDGVTYTSLLQVGGDAAKVQNLLEGTYKVIVTDANDCTVESAEYTITNPYEPTIDYDVSDVTVYEGSDGKIVLDDDFATYYSYKKENIVWYYSDATHVTDASNVNVTGYTASGLKAGSYYFVLTYDNACTYTSDLITVSQPGVLTYSVVPENVSCYDAGDGIISVHISQGTPTYTVVLTGTPSGGTTFDTQTQYGADTEFTDLLPGSYTVTITDENDPASTIAETVTIEQPDEITITPTITNVTCNGLDNGTISLAVYSGSTDVTATATFQWYKANGYSAGTESFIEELSPGNYYAVVYYTNPNTSSVCSVTTEGFTITEPNPITFEGAHTDVSCNGDETGTITVNVNGRDENVTYTYAWYQITETEVGGVITETETLLSSTTNTIDKLGAGDYKVKVTANDKYSCTADTTITISEPEAIKLTVTPTDIITCQGEADGALDLYITGGTAPYTIDYGGTETLTSNDGYLTIDNLVAGDYKIIVYDYNGCNTSWSGNISEPSDPIAITVNTATIGCEKSDGVIDFTVTDGVNDSGYDYTVTIKGNVDGQVIYSFSQNYTNTTGSETINKTDLVPGNYIITAVDNNSSNSGASCATATSDTIKLRNIEISGIITNPTCSGVSNGAIDVTIEGSDNYAVTWSTTDGTGLNDSEDQSGLSDGTYTIVVADINKIDSNNDTCKVSKSFTLVNSKVVSVTGSVSDISCNGETDGAIDITASGSPTNDYTYEWTNVASDSVANEDQTGLAAGSYRVKVTTTLDGESCSDTEDFTVVEPSAIDFSLSYALTSCEDESENTVFARTISVSTVTGGTGAYTYTWTGTDIEDISQDDYPTEFKVYKGGTYTLTVTDGNNCETTHSITIPDEIEISAETQNVTCKGGNDGYITINVTGGSNVYSYSWVKKDDTSFSKSTASIEDLYAGTYTLTVTDKGEGYCTKTYTYTVTQPTAIIISGTITDVTCNGDADGIINATITGGTAPYTYKWSTGATTKNISGLSGGNYSVTVTDAVGCTNSGDFVVNEENPIVVTTEKIVDTYCDGTDGAIAIKVTGGSGSYTYNWATSDGSGLDIDAEDQSTLKDGVYSGELTGGTYTVVVTDAADGKNTCTATYEATLTSAIEISNESVTNVTCEGLYNGAISFDVTGGDGDYTYAWSASNGGDASKLNTSEQTQSGLSAGTYTVVITDGRTDANSLDCSVSKTFTIENTAALDVAVSIDDAECFNDPSGSLTAFVTGGSGDYSYYWNDSTIAGNNGLINLTQGSYRLTVVDNELGCSTSGEYEVEGPADPLSIDAIATTDLTCYNSYTGKISVTVSGGTPYYDTNNKPSYTYSWDGPTEASGASPDNLAAGTYTVTVFDANGCSVNSEDIIITQPASALTITDPEVTNVTTKDGSNGEISVTIAGGTSSYDIAWYVIDEKKEEDNRTVIPSATTSHITGLEAGLYEVVVYDANDCDATYTNIRVNEPDMDLGFDYTSYNVSPCYGSDNGEIHIDNIYGGTPINSSTYHIEISGNNTNVDVTDSDYDLTDLAAGTYVVTITDGANEYVTKTIIITEAEELTINATVSGDISCYGGTSTIKGSVSGGSPRNKSDYYYVEISSADGYYANDTTVTSEFTFDELPASKYVVKVSDHAADFDAKVPSRGSCEATTDTLYITQSEVVVAISGETGNNTICTGDSYQLALNVSDWDFTDGNLSVTVFDNTSSKPYTVDESPFYITVSPTKNSVYTITKVENEAKDCVKGYGSGSVPVYVNALPTANISGPSEVCNGATVDMTVTLTGTAPWTITWVDNNNGTSQTVEGIETSTYTFSDTPVADPDYTILAVSDANGCSGESYGEVEVTLNDLPDVTLSGGTTICEGASTDLTLTFTSGTPSYTITYEANGVEGTKVITPDDNDQYTWTVSPDITTTYEITKISDNKDCEVALTSSSVTSTVYVNKVPEEITAITTEDGAEVCQGSSGAVYTIEAVEYATRYEWTAPDGAAILNGDGTTEVTLFFDEDFAGGYLKVYAQNTCGESSEKEYWISADLLPADFTSAPEGDTNVCEGEAGLVYTIDPVLNATSYEWYASTGLNIVGNQTGTTITIDVDENYNDFTGTIKVRAVNDCGESAWSDELEVTVTPLPVPDAGMDEATCEDSYTMDAVDPGTGYEGTWTRIEGTSQMDDSYIHNPNAVLTALNHGDNVYVWTVRNTTTGCTSSDTVAITNNNVNVEILSWEDQVCNGIVTLTGTSVYADADEGYWTIVDGSGNFDDASESTVNVTDMAVGSNTFRWTIRKGECESYAEVTVVNNQTTSAYIYDENSNFIDTIDVDCGTTSVNLIGSSIASDETAQWRILSGYGEIDNVNSSSVTISNLAKGKNVVSYTIQKEDCTSSDTIVVRNNSLTVSAGSDVTTCDSEVILDGTVNNSDGVTGLWTVIEGDATFDDATDPNTAVTNLSRENSGRNVLRWTLKKNRCESYDDMVIIYNAPSDAEIQGDISNVSVCDYEYDLLAVDPDYGTGKWTVLSGDGDFEDDTSYSTTVSGIAKGENVYRWTVSNGICSSSVDITITNELLDVYAGADTTVCSSSATLDADDAPENASGEWYIADGMGSGMFIPDNTSSNTSVSSLSSGDNYLIWKVTTNNCISRDTVIITNGAPTPVEATTSIETDEDYTTLRAYEVELGTGLWTLVEGRGTIENPLSNTTLVTNLYPNVNVFRWTVTNGVCSDYVDVEVTSGDLSDAEAGNDQTLCEDYTTLSANQPENTIGEWSVIQGSCKFENDNYNDAEASIYDLAHGENLLVWTLSFAGNSTNSNSDTVAIYNNSPSDANAGYDLTTCDSEITLQAQEPVYGTPYWTILSGGGVFDDRTSPTATVTELDHGLSIIKYTITNENCTSYDTMNVYNYEASVAYAGEDMVVCADSAQLSPTIPKYGEGSWSIVKGSGKGKDADGNFTSEITGNYIYELAQGENVLVWAVQVEGSTSDCINRDTLIIVNHEPSVSYAGGDRIVCGDSTNLSGSNPIYGDGTWTLISGSGEFADSSATNTAVTNLSIGDNIFMWTVDNEGCTSSSQVTISNNMLETIAGDDQTICVDTTTLEANNALPGSGTWSVASGIGKFDDSSNPNAIVSELSQGDNIFVWSIYYDGCTNTDTVIISNDSPTTAKVNSDIPTCNNYAELTATEVTIGSGEWTVQSGSGIFEDSSAASTRVDSLNFGTNIYRWTTTNESCFSYDEVQVDYNYKEADAGEDKTVCANSTYLEGNAATPGTGTWTLIGSGSSADIVSSNDPVSLINDLAKGENTLRWTIVNEGCTSTDEVTITNSTPSTSYAGSSEAICDDTYTLDATAASIGTGSWSIISGAGTITNENDPKSDVSDLSQGSNVFRWTISSADGMCTTTDDVTITNNTPSTPYAGAGQDICSSTIVLNAAEPDYGTGEWSIQTGGGNFDDLSLAEATVTNINKDENIFRWTVTQGQCELYADVTIVNNTPTTADAGPDISDCNNYAYMDANEPEDGSGTWILSTGNGDITDDSDPKSLIDNLTFGENIFTWKIAKGNCFSTDQVSIYNNIPDSAVAGSDRTTCDDYITLNANTPDLGEGQWDVVSGAGTFDDVNDPKSIVRNMGLGENIFKWVITYDECSTEDEVAIVSNMTDPKAGVDDTTYVDSYTLAATNPGDELSGVWTVAGGSGTFVDATDFNTTVSGLSEGENTFRWTLSYNDCETYDDVSITYLVTPEVSFIVDTAQGCYPLVVNYTNYAVNGVSYLWDFGDGNISTDQNTTHTFEDPGTYTTTLQVVSKASSDVTSSYSMEINVFDHPVADFTYGPDTVYIPGDELRCYSTSEGASTYLWDFGDGGTSTEVNPLYEYEDLGTYDITLNVVSEYGCEDEITKVDAVTVVEQGFIVFPNAFTPRSDGSSNASSTGGLESNTVFRPVYSDIAEYKLEIYNRWGQLIYQSTDIDEGWNGFYNGQLGAQAVYVWKASGRYVSGTEFSKAGSVLLVR